MWPKKRESMADKLLYTEDFYCDNCHTNQTTYIHKGITVAAMKNMGMKCPRCDCPLFGKK